MLKAHTQPSLETAMDKCYVCGAETDLYVNGTPLCPACDRETKIQPRLQHPGPDQRLPEGAEARVTGSPISRLRFPWAER